MALPLVLLGAPSSAGSYGPGQEQAPRVLRELGLESALRNSGRLVDDRGDGPLQVWSPDSRRPYFQNADDVAEELRWVFERCRFAFEEGAQVLVIGGNCTIAASVIAALAGHAGDAHLVYIDRHFDLNTPESTTDGAIDWMGMAAALSVGAGTELSGILADSRPLDPKRLHYLGVEEDAATEWERQQVAGLGIDWGTSEALATDPAGEARRVLDAVSGDAFAVHVDVDVLDFTDAPLAENTDGRNTGPKLAQLAVVLSELCADPRFRALSIGELNPARSAGTPTAIPRFIRIVADALGAPSPPDGVGE